MKRGSGCRSGHVLVAILLRGHADRVGVHDDPPLEKARVTAHRGAGEHDLRRLDRRTAQLERLDIGGPELVADLDDDRRDARRAGGRGPRDPARAGVDGHARRAAQQLVDKCIAVGVYGPHVIGVGMSRTQPGRGAGDNLRRPVPHARHIVWVAATKPFPGKRRKVREGDDTVPVIIHPQGAREDGEKRIAPIETAQLADGRDADQTTGGRNGGHRPKITALALDTGDGRSDYVPEHPARIGEFDGHLLDARIARPGD